MVYDNDYNGPRYMYGCVARPACYGSVPDGQIIGGQRESKGEMADFPNFGTISYPYPLTQGQVWDFELVPLQSDGLPEVELKEEIYGGKKFKVWKCGHCGRWNDVPRTSSRFVDDLVNCDGCHRWWKTKEAEG